MQVRLPDEVTLTLTPNEVITIMGALQEYGPYKAIFPIVRKIEQQLLSQQLKPEFKGPPRAIRRSLILRPGISPSDERRSEFPRH